jgi:type IV pilus assembly protein PilC
MLLKAGISISGALDILREQLDDKTLIPLCDLLYQDVLKGISLSDAMRNTEKLPDLLVNTIAAGENGGFLDEVMERMAIYYEKETKLSSKVKSSLIYPCMVLIVTAVVVYVLLTKVVPQFATMFDTMNVELPLLTRILIGMGEFLSKYWLIVFLLLGSLITALIFYLKTPTGSFQKDATLLKIPLIKNIVLKSIIARFTRTISIMLKTGVPMINALEFSSRVLGNKVMEKGMAIVKEEVATGHTLAEPIQNLELFPKMVVSMVRIGEETGALDEMMSKCADFYDDVVELLSMKITSLIEPMIILVLAVIVGTVVMAIVLPMFEMYSSIA